MEFLEDFSITFQVEIWKFLYSDVTWILEGRLYHLSEIMENFQNVPKIVSLEWIFVLGRL